MGLRLCLLCAMCREKICSMKLGVSDMEDLMIYGVAFMVIAFVAHFVVVVFFFLYS